MKSIYKLLIDIGPLAVFFIFYTRGDLKTAIVPFMIATIIAVLFSYIIEKKIPIMPTVGGIIILIIVIKYICIHIYYRIAVCRFKPIYSPYFRINIISMYLYY